MTEVKSTEILKYFIEMSIPINEFEEELAASSPPFESELKRSAKAHHMFFTESSTAQF